MSFRGLAGSLPAGDYRLSKIPAGMAENQVALAFALGAYPVRSLQKSHSFGSPGSWPATKKPAWPMPAPWPGT